MYIDRQNQSGSWHRKRVRPQRKPRIPDLEACCRLALCHVHAWGSVAACCSTVRQPTAVTADFVRGHPPQMPTCVQTAQSSTVFQVQSSLLRAPTTNVSTGPVATPATCGVICHLQPVWIKFALTRFVQHLPPFPPTRRPHGPTRTKTS
jgi:hypothetical protein